MTNVVMRGRFQHKTWLVRRDGSRFFAEINVNPVYDEQNQPSGFACVMRDITEQQRMDDLLRLSEDRLRLATEAGQVGIWEYIVESDKWVLDDTGSSLMGLPADSTPAYDALFGRVHPDDRQRARDTFQHALATSGEVDLELRTVTSQDSETWIEVHGKVLVDEAGKPHRVIGTSRNVTERHHYDVFRELLPGILAHDLRSPLSTIKMAGEQLQKEGLGGASNPRMTDIILRSTDHMARMVERLLRFTEVRFGGPLPLAREPTDLAEVTRQVVTEAQLAHPDTNVYFEATGDTRGSWDATRLGEVASNLVGNALKYGPHDKPVDVMVRGNGSEVVLEVHNQGSPIPTEDMPFIYDPFRGAGRAPGNSRSKGSLGLGLYITRSLVNAHGGSIEVSSTEQAGTTFTVHLPR
jgi:PAS domain S-box-containing protein